MSTVIHPARGASAFTYQDAYLCYPATEVGTGSTGGEDTAANSWNELIDELLRMRSLEDDWDGEGSAAPPLPLVHGAIKLAQALKRENHLPAERVVVSVNGTIYFEWHTPFGYEEIEVISPRDAELRRVKMGSDVSEVLCFMF